MKRTIEESGYKYEQQEVETLPKKTKLTPQNEPVESLDEDEDLMSITTPSSTSDLGENSRDLEEPDLLCYEEKYYDIEPPISINNNEQIIVTAPQYIQEQQIKTDLLKYLKEIEEYKYPEFDSFELAKLLLLFDIKKHIADKDGNTLLHHAASEKSSEMLQFLVDQGCDVNVKNKDELTPLDLALDSYIYEEDYQGAPNDLNNYEAITKIHCLLDSNARLNDLGYFRKAKIMFLLESKELDFKLFFPEITDPAELFQELLDGNNAASAEDYPALIISLSDKAINSILLALFEQTPDDLKITGNINYGGDDFLESLD